MVDMCVEDIGFKEIKALMLPNPEETFERSKVALSIQPHPDDADIAAGGMIAKLVNGGRRVVMLGLLKRVFALIGAKAGYRYAEAFKVLNANTLHCNICGRPIA